MAFTLTGQPSDQDWFSINSSSGQIYVAKDVRQDPLKRTQYLVSNCAKIWICIEIFKNTTLTICPCANIQIAVISLHV